ncbi:hypothetical protein RMSM_01535 [Rhodopirellula maiorica SM1]|uniref:Uncharacterized protein n=1 Tax=Rhodopirellula maiorica SM1 TaxID=1265738 RepID=M5RQG4_9BACT|nr:hypothetical protein [Rhodopirellula maiorica]EMI21535.1 hypothetical protein RMSM_01535 [Rhodopirellula maiorica SM1]
MISKARYELDNKWLQLQVQDRDKSTDEGKFAALAHRLEDVSANLGDSYTVSVERERAGDSDRRDLYRGLLQQALLQYAETVLALDEMASVMARVRGFEPDFDSPMARPELGISHTVKTPDANRVTTFGADVSMLKQKNDSTNQSLSLLNLELSGKAEKGHWQIKRGRLIGSGAPHEAVLSLGNVAFEKYDLVVDFVLLQRDSQRFADLIFSLPVVQRPVCLRNTKKNETIIGFWGNTGLGDPTTSRTFSTSVPMQVTHRLVIRVRGESNVELMFNDKLVKSLTALPNVKKSQDGSNELKVILSPAAKVIFDKIDVVNQSQ